MAWYYGTYACGHEGRTNIVGPTKDRQWKSDAHFRRNCPECIEEERKQESELAKQQAESLGLPELTGSEKQIDWAVKLRQEQIDEYSKMMQDATDNMEEYKVKVEDFEERVEHTKRTFDYIIETKTRAGYWIDNRSSTIQELILPEMDNAPTEKELEENKMERKSFEESTVKPNVQLHRSVAFIRLTQGNVTVEYEKNNDFIKLVRDLGFRWDGRLWTKTINERTGTAEDRAAELGNELLNNGFPISILNKNILENAVEGNFEPECTNWILEDGKDLKIIWKGFDNNLYDEARTLPGARWRDRGMVVNVAHYKELRDFANIHGFKFSRVAEQTIEEFVQAERNFESVDPVKVTEVTHDDKLNDILDSSGDILDDLKD